MEPGAGPRIVFLSRANPWALFGNIFLDLPPATELYTLQFLMERGRVRAEKRVGATSTKRKVVAALSNSPTAKRKKSFSTLKDSKSPKDQISRETFGNPSDTYRGVSMNP